MSKPHKTISLTFSQIQATAIADRVVLHALSTGGELWWKYHGENVWKRDTSTREGVADEPPMQTPAAVPIAGESDLFDVSDPVERWVQQIPAPREEEEKMIRHFACPDSVRPAWAERVATWSTIQGRPFNSMLLQQELVTITGEATEERMKAILELTNRRQSKRIIYGEDYDSAGGKRSRRGTKSDSPGQKFDPSLQEEFGDGF